MFLTKVSRRWCFCVPYMLTILHQQPQIVSCVDSRLGPFGSSEELDAIDVDDIQYEKARGRKIDGHGQRKKRRRHLRKKSINPNFDASKWRFPVLHSKGLLQHATDLENGGKEGKEIMDLLTVSNVKNVAKQHHDKYWSILQNYYKNSEPHTNNGGSGPALQHALSMLRKRQEHDGPVDVQPVSHRDLTVLPAGELIVWKGKNPNNLVYSAYDGDRTLVMDRPKDRNGVSFVLPEVGAAWADDFGYDETTVEEYGPKYESDYMSKIDKITEVEGNHVYWGVYFQGVFAHIMLDYIAYFSYLKDHLPDDAKMLILDSGDKVRNMFEAIDPKFAGERITFVPCVGQDSGSFSSNRVKKKFEFMNQVGIMCHEQLVRVRNGSLIIMHPTIFHRHMDYFISAREWLHKGGTAASRDNTGQVSFPKRNKVIYETRNPLHLLEDALNADDPLSAAKRLQISVDPKESGVHNGRLMDLEQEVTLVKMVKSVMRRHQFQRYTGRATNRSDEPLELVLFDGRMPFRDTIDLFQSANIVIGPHGGAMANTLLLLDGDEENKVKVLEFITSPLTPDLQLGAIARSYFLMFNTAPWIDEYHHILYVPPSSDSGKTHVNIQDFNDALKSIFKVTNKTSTALLE